MTTRPEAALLDMGNVLFHVGFVTALADLVPGPAADRQARLQSLCEKHDDFECGRIGEDEFVAWASRRLGFDGTPEVFRRAWCTNLVPIEPMWEELPRLRAAGLRLILFSNTNPIHSRWLKANHPLGQFDGEVFSHAVGAMKPDPAIYRHAIDRHGLDPRRTLYIDDLAPNIRAGRAHGLQCHCYDPSRHHDLRRWLDHRFDGR